MEITVKVFLSIGISNAERSDVFTIEVEDDATEDEINEAKELAAIDWANNFIEVWTE